MTVRDELKSAIEKYELAVSDESLSESHVDALFDIADKLVPNAQLSDIVHYSERSLDEIVEEALYREELWERGGDRAVLLHALAQAQAVMADPNASVTERACAERLLPGMERELKELGTKLN